MRPLSRAAIAGALGAMAGAALTAGWLGGRGAPPAVAPDPPPRADGASPGALDDRLDALAAALDAERTARRALAEQVASLRARLAPADDPPKSADADRGDAGRPDAPDGAGFDEDALRSLRIGEGDVERLRERYDALALQELYVRNRAAREGWAHQPRLAERLRQLRQGVRNDLGDEDYDRLLFAAGRNNRVIVAGVLPNSPAERAGIQRGDVVVAYGDRRIFDGRELTRATTAGKAGAWTALEVRRNGVDQRVFVPRGPLGVRLRPARRPPDEG